MSVIDNFQHTSVLLEESIKRLNIQANGKYMDGTTGGAGHSSEILKELSQGGILLCFDKDTDALQTAESRLQAIESEGEFNLVQENFAEFDQVLFEKRIDKLDGVILDLGVSSWQLDEASRGFSYMNEGPLDMRMDNTSGESARDFIARASAEEIADVFYKYGEQRNSRRIARAIVQYREEVGEITTTTQLADIIIKAQPARSRREKQHPAKRSFQALRIHVNGELKDVEDFLEKIPNHMNPEGRIAIISFHSLEDRLVKQAFRKWEDPCECPPQLPCTCGKLPLGKAYPRNGVIASEEEMENNPRARSARLRVFIRNDNPVI